MKRFLTFLRPAEPNNNSRPTQLSNCCPPVWVYRPIIILYHLCFVSPLCTTLLKLNDVASLLFTSLNLLYSIYLRSSICAFTCIADLIYFTSTYSNALKLNYWQLCVIVAGMIYKRFLLTSLCRIFKHLYFFIGLFIGHIVATFQFPSDKLKTNSYLINS